MPSNQEYKGKGTKGRDGGVGTPDLADPGKLQSARPGAQAGQPGGTPAQGDSWRSQGSQQSAQADQLRGNQGDRQLGARQESQDEVGSAKPSER